MRKLFLILIVLSMLATVPASIAQDTPLHVVATTTIIADVAQNVGGHLVMVTALVPPDSDIHAFQPSPQDVAAVADADVVLVNGAGLEMFLADLVENAAGVEPVVVSNGIAMLAFGDHGHEDDQDAGMSDMGHGGMAMSGAVTGGYVIITNNGSTADTLVNVQVDHVGMVELHQTIVENDVARMEPMTNGIEIPAGETVELRPGSFHMMLMDVQQTFAVGDTLTLTLMFASGAELVIPAVIGEVAPETADTVTVGDLSATLAWVRPVEVMAAEAAETGHTHGAMDMPMATEEAEMGHSHAAAETDHDHEMPETIGILGKDADCGEDDGMGHTHSDDEADHEHGACDPHVWTNPHHVMVWADNIAAAFAAADPDNAEIYMANAAAYKDQLAALDAEITEILSVIPQENRIIVTNHETMGYFAAHYGFEVVGVVIAGGTTLSEPDPQTLAALVETIREEGVRAIFAENTTNATLAEAVAAEVGDSVVIATLYTDALSAADGAAPTYLDYLRFNAQTIAAALAGA